MEDQFPMRINKFLARAGHATRRGADDLIKNGSVLINGRVAVLGDKVEASDDVTVKQPKRKRGHRYVAYHKPRGVVTHSAQEGDSDIADVLPEELEGLFPVGRLDKDSYGLIILTDDGRITSRLLSPDSEHEKEYSVRTKNKLRSNFKERMEEGVFIEGYRTKPCRVRITGERSFSITLTEGKKHQIRRMVVALYNEVEDLKRTRVMNIRMGPLKAGEFRAIEGTELAEFLTALGL